MKTDAWYNAFDDTFVINIYNENTDLTVHVSRKQAKVLKNALADELKASKKESK